MVVTVKCLLGKNTGTVKEVTYFFSMVQLAHHGCIYIGNCIIYNQDF